MGARGQASSCAGVGPGGRGTPGRLGCPLSIAGSFGGLGRGDARGKRDGKGSGFIYSLGGRILKFQILSHAGLRVNGAGKELLFDPWLVGSTYWRSWWNYPPPPRDVIASLKPDFIYLTHIHWDHFQGPSLRLFPRETRVIVPKDHNPRLKRDLNQIGFRNVTELRHGETLRLAEGFTLTSYQFYPFTDSAAVVECDGTVLLNANDAKFMGRPLEQILRRHPGIDFVLRSHSSANPRICYRYMDGVDGEVPAPESNDDYGRDFADFAVKCRARYAIPFASNHCFLHREVFGLNHTVTTPVQVQEHFRGRGITVPELKVMVAGDSWSGDSGFSISGETWFQDRPARLADYAREKAPILEKFYAQEARTDVALAQVEKYFGRFRGALAWPLRRLFRGRPIAYALTGKQPRFYVIDLYAGEVSEVPALDDAQHPLQIHTSSFIFKQCMAVNLFLHLGISKRVIFRCRRADAKFLWILEFLFNMYECEMLPLRRMAKPRFILAWLPRWREIFLYAQVLTRKLTGKPFRMRDYLEPTPNPVPSPNDPD
jgi:UDP-MurNAc hydroxylase